MFRFIALSLTCLALAALPSDLSAQCAQCTHSWWSGDGCKHCAGGSSCGESCKFDSYGNCYMPIACGVGGDPDVSLEEVVTDRGILELPAAVAAMADVVRVEEVGADLLVQWSCQGTPEQVWRIEGARLVSVTIHEAGPALERAQRRRHLRLLLA